MNIFFFTPHSQFNENKYKSTGQWIKETLWRGSLACTCIWSKSRFLLRVDLRLQFRYKWNDAACSHVGTCTISSYPNTANMFVKIIAGARYMYKCSVKWTRNRKVWWIIISSAWLFWSYHVWMAGSCTGSHECAGVSVQKSSGWFSFVILRKNNNVFCFFCLGSCTEHCSVCYKDKCQGDAGGVTATDSRGYELKQGDFKS